MESGIHGFLSRVITGKTPSQDVGKVPMSEFAKVFCGFLDIFCNGGATAWWEKYQQDDVAQTKWPEVSTIVLSVVNATPSKNGIVISEEKAIRSIEDFDYSSWNRDTLNKGSVVTFSDGTTHRVPASVHDIHRDFTRDVIANKEKYNIGNNADAVNTCVKQVHQKTIDMLTKRPLKINWKKLPDGGLTLMKFLSDLLSTDSKSTEHTLGDFKVKYDAAGTKKISIESDYGSGELTGMSLDDFIQEIKTDFFDNGAKYCAELATVKPAVRDKIAGELSTMLGHIGTPKFDQLDLKVFAKTYHLSSAQITVEMLQDPTNFALLTNKEKQVLINIELAKFDPSNLAINAFTNSAASYPDGDKVKQEVQTELDSIYQRNANQHPLVNYALTHEFRSEVGKKNEGVVEENNLERLVQWPQLLNKLGSSQPFSNEELQLFNRFVGMGNTKVTEELLQKLPMLSDLQKTALRNLDTKAITELKIGLKNVARTMEVALVLGKVGSDQIVDDQDRKIFGQLVGLSEASVTNKLMQLLPPLTDEQQKQLLAGDTNAVKKLTELAKLVSKVLNVTDKIGTSRFDAVALADFKEIYNIDGTQFNVSYFQDPKNFPPLREGEKKLLVHIELAKLDEKNRKPAEDENLSIPDKLLVKMAVSQELHELYRPGDIYNPSSRGQKQLPLFKENELLPDSDRKTLGVAVTELDLNLKYGDKAGTIFKRFTYEVIEDSIENGIAPGVNFGVKNLLVEYSLSMQCITHDSEGDKKNRTELNPIVLKDQVSELRGYMRYKDDIDAILMAVYKAHGNTLNVTRSTNSAERNDL